jgi:hypothetical protein
MRRTSIISALLILILQASVSVCMAGWGIPATNSCPQRGSRQSCVRKKSGVETPRPACEHVPCGRVLRSLPDRCGIRSFVQFQAVAFRADQISTPHQFMFTNIAAPIDSRIIVSSIGSPETDRGPPAS